MSDDGISLEAAAHPVEITADMVAAGVEAAHKTLRIPDTELCDVEDMVKSVFNAMIHAAPELPEDISKEALDLLPRHRPSIAVNWPDWRRLYSGSRQ